MISNEKSDVYYAHPTTSLTMCVPYGHAMSDARRVVAVGILPMLIAIIMTPSAFAENPTPYDEWDFDIISDRFTVSQSPSDLERMTVKVPIQYNGEFPMGTTNVYVTVTDPAGKVYTMFGQTRDLEIGQTQVMQFEYVMRSDDGTYAVHVSLKSPSTLHQNWHFDSEVKYLEIKKNGLLDQLETRGVESGLITMYYLADTSEIRYDEVVHAKVSLPENHNFEKIALVNGDFVKEYSTDVKDIYIDGEHRYDDMKIKLVQHGNLLPMADAQHTLQEYIVFYAMDRGQCVNAYCVRINVDDYQEEFPYEIAAVVAVIGVGIGVAVYFLSNRPVRPFVSGGVIGGNNDQRDKEIKRYMSPIK